MVLFIILVSVLVGCIVSFKWFEYNDVPAIPIIFGFISGIWLLIFCILTSISSYEYERFVVCRNAFEQTLSECRKNGNQYETATIVKEVSDWNQKLAENKLDNSKFLMDTYVDDRFEQLKPIK